VPTVRGWSSKRLTWSPFTDDLAVKRRRSMLAAAAVIVFAPRISVGLARRVSIAARLLHPRRLLTPRCDQPGRPSLLEIGRSYTPLPKGWVA
jgi:hypothetical protein